MSDREKISSWYLFVEQMNEWVVLFDEVPTDEQGRLLVVHEFCANKSRQLPPLDVVQVYHLDWQSWGLRFDFGWYMLR